jgi:hypothetical protein
MRRLSSRMTFFCKRVFPVIWFGFLALFIAVPLNRGDEARGSLGDIKNVSYPPFTNPPRVTLSLRSPTVFGDEITFNAPTRFMPFSPSPVIKKLIDRLDLARRMND